MATQYAEQLKATTAPSAELDKIVGVAADLARDNFGTVGSSVRPLLSASSYPTVMSGPRPHATFPEILAALRPLAEKVLDEWPGTLTSWPGKGEPPSAEQLYFEGRRVIVDELVRRGLELVPALRPVLDRINALCTSAAGGPPSVRAGSSEYQKALGRLAPGFDEKLTSSIQPNSGWILPRTIAGIGEWKTSTTLTPFGQMEVLATIELHPKPDDAKEVYDLVSVAIDPRNWARDDPLFWKCSDRIPSDDSRIVQLQPIGTSWHGTLREIVHGLTEYQVELEVDYIVDYEHHRTQATYRFKSSTEGIIADDGYVFADLVDGTAPLIRVEVFKRLAFRNTPYASASSLTTITPSYVGSWLRTQLDVWAANVEQPVAVPTWITLCRLSDRMLQLSRIARSRP